MHADLAGAESGEKSLVAFAGGRFGIAIAATDEILVTFPKGPDAAENHSTHRACAYKTIHRMTP